mmetsp:Transcript_41383/g.99003  ORF Transcript_41383/g.99003 Transcript_41383/m.99003 type:complete len:258 (-) Transcript_41383:449-1222(-)
MVLGLRHGRRPLRQLGWSVREVALGRVHVATVLHGSVYGLRRRGHSVEKQLDLIVLAVRSAEDGLRELPHRCAVDLLHGEVAPVALLEERVGAVEEEVARAQVPEELLLEASRQDTNVGVDQDAGLPGPELPQQRRGPHLRADGAGGVAPHDELRELGVHARPGPVHRGSHLRVAVGGGREVVGGLPGPRHVPCKQVAGARRQPDDREAVEWIGPWALGEEAQIVLELDFRLAGSHRVAGHFIPASAATSEVDVEFV